MKQLLAIFSGVIALQALPASAQVARFQVDDRQHFVIESYKPHSEVTFYPAMNGGQILKFTRLDAQGGFSFTESLNFKPLRAYNPITPDHANTAAGSGKIETLEPKEFTVGEFELHQQDDHYTISWRGGLNDKDKIEYRVFKSTNGTDFKLLATYGSPVNSAMEPFMVEDHERSNCVYKIDVWNASKEKLRYQSRLLSLSTFEVNIYPTLVQAQVNIDVLTNDAHAQYTIINNLGQRLATGSLQAGKNTIDVSALSKGIYIIQVQGGNTTRNARIIKVD